MWKLKRNHHINLTRINYGLPQISICCVVLLMLHIHFWMQHIHFWTQHIIIGHIISIAGHIISIAGLIISISGYSMYVTGHSISISGYSISISGYKTFVTGHSISIPGNIISISEDTAYPWLDFLGNFRFSRMPLFLNKLLIPAIQANSLLSCRSFRSLSMLGL